MNDTNHTIIFDNVKCFFEGRSNYSVIALKEETVLLLKGGGISQVFKEDTQDNALLFAKEFAEQVPETHIYIEVAEVAEVNARAFDATTPLNDYAYTTKNTDLFTVKSGVISKITAVAPRSNKTGAKIKPFANVSINESNQRDFKDIGNGVDFSQSINSWLEALPVTVGSTVLNFIDLVLDGKAHYKINGKYLSLDNSKDCPYYIGSYTNGVPVITFRAHVKSSTTIGTYNGWDFVRSHNQDKKPLPRMSAAKELEQKARQKRNAKRAANEAENKKRFFERKLSEFDNLPIHTGIDTFPEDSYFINKKKVTLDDLESVNFHSDFRPGKDKHGAFSCVAYRNLKTNELVALQRVYGEAPKNRGSNKLLVFGSQPNLATFKFSANCTAISKDIYIVESFVDAMRINIATGCEVHAVGTAGNIVGVAEHFAAHLKTLNPFDKGKVILVADNDQYNPASGNKGVSIVLDTAEKLGFDFVIPMFEDVDMDCEPKDIWDYHDLYGEAALEKLLAAPLSSNIETVLFNAVKQRYLPKPVGKDRELSQEIFNIFQKYKVKAPANRALYALIKGLEQSAKKENKPFDFETIKRDANRELDTLFSDWRNGCDTRLKKYAIPEEKYRYKFNSKYVRLSHLSGGYETIGIDEIPHRVILVDSPMGTGKTQIMSELLEKCPLAINIVPRISIANSVAGRFPQLQSYQKIGKEGCADKVVTVINSLPKILSSLQERLATEDLIVFLDEIDFLIKMAHSDFIDKSADQTKILSAMREILLGATHVIGFQDGISTVTYNYLLSCGITEDEILLVKNEYKPFDGVKANQFGSKSALLQHLKGMFTEDKKVFSVFNSRREAKVFWLACKNQYADKEFLLITSKNSGNAAQLAFLRNPTEESKKYDGIFVSPVVAQGVDIQNPEYGNVVAIIDTGIYYGTHDMCVQMMFRCRKVHTIDMFLCGTSYSFADDQDLWLQIYTGRFMEDVVKAKGMNDTYSERDGEISFVVENNLIKVNMLSGCTSSELKTKASCAASERSSQREMSGNIWTTLKKMGVTLYDNFFEDKQVESEGTDSLKEANETRKEFEEEALFKAKELTKEEYENLNGTHDMTEEEKLQCEKHALTNTYALDVFPSEQEDFSPYFKKWQDGGGVRPFKNLGAASLTDEQRNAIISNSINFDSVSSKMHGFNARATFFKELCGMVGLSFDKDNRAVIDHKKRWNFEDFYETDIWKLFFNDKTASAKAGLGFLYKNKKPNLIISAYLRELGISSKRTTKVFKKGEKPTRVRRIDLEESSFCIDIFNKRIDNGTAPYVKRANNIIAMEIAMEIA